MLKEIHVHIYKCLFIMFIHFCKYTLMHVESCLQHFACVSLNEKNAPSATTVLHNSQNKMRLTKKKQFELVPTRIGLQSFFERGLPGVALPGHETYSRDRSYGATVFQKFPIEDHSKRCHACQKRLARAWSVHFEL